MRHAYIYIYIYMYTCINTHTHTQFTHFCAQLHAHIHTCTHI